MRYLRGDAADNLYRYPVSIAESSTLHTQADTLSVGQRTQIAINYLQGRLFDTEYK